MRDWRAARRGVMVAACGCLLLSRCFAQSTAQDGTKSAVPAASPDTQTGPQLQPKTPPGSMTTSQPADAPPAVVPRSELPSAPEPSDAPADAPTQNSGPSRPPIAGEAVVHRGILNPAPKNEPSTKPGIDLADPMLYGPVTCQSSVLGIANPEAAAANQAQETGEQSCAHSASPTVNLFLKFTSTWVPYPMTPEQKLKLAYRDVIDPFNLLTIGGLAAIDIASNSHTDYGPGLKGFSKDAGVTFTQDMTGEFFGTFLICTIAHQDPHYHRMPQASLKMRIGHALAQVIVTQSDTGRPMFNFEDTLGYLVDDKISSLYVPGQQSDAKSTASRVLIGLATAPIGNFVSEFVPDLARRVNIHAIFVQRIINQVARDNGDAGP